MFGEKMNCTNLFISTFFMMILLSPIHCFASTVNFDSLPSATAIVSSGNVTFGSNLTGNGLITSNQFMTSSSPNSLGVDDPKYQVFLPGDSINLNFAKPITGLIVYFVSTPVTPAGVLSIDTPVGSSQNTDIPITTLSDGSEVYTVSFTSLTPFSTATLNSLEGEVYSFNVDDITLQYLLTATIDGSGGGDINSLPAGINCPGVNCSSQYDEGTTVLLTQTPDVWSLFGGWTGLCEVLGGNCSVLVDNVKIVNATFNVASKVKVESDYYDKLQDAYDNKNTVDNAVIQLLNDSAVGAFTTTPKGINLTIKGAYDPMYKDPSGALSIINSPFNINSGSIRVNNVVVR
jgi:hypothetical protein